MPIKKLVDLDDISLDEIEQWLAVARAIENGRREVSRLLEAKVLCPLFGQESSRTFINSVTSFQRMGGTVLPISQSGTRFGSKWKEPVQDFAVLLNSCCDHIIFRDSDMQKVRDIAALVDIPFINAGNGMGVGSEHPMQELVDLFTIREAFAGQKIRILMMGGSHIRTTRTQIKLFLRCGYEVSVMSPRPEVDNSDIDALIESQCRTIPPSDLGSWQDYDLIYHNGIDENPDAEAPRSYWLSLERLKQRKFNGYVMHSLPRKNELSDCVDDTFHNLYFRQMRASQWVFQSVFLHQELAQRTTAHAA